MLKVLLTSLFVSILFISNAQQCAGPGRDPITAQAVCGTLTFIESDVSNCTGPDLPSQTSGCADQVSTDNSRWYKFHCYQAGTFGFIINPASVIDDYDWEVMDITGHNPSDVYTVELRISLSLSGQPGKTGCTAAGTQDVNCAGGAPGTQFNRLLNLTAGHDYLIMINNYSSSGAPYSITFSGTAVLTDNAIPTITSVGIVGCDASKLKVTFSEDMLCSTMTPIGSEFIITGGPNAITGVVSCAPGGYSVPYLIINLQNPLAPGPYTLMVDTGTDNDVFKNVCRQELLETAIPFTVAAQVPLDITTVNFTGCAPKFLDIPFSKPFICSSVTAAGSEFSITPGNPAISSISYNCTNDRATSLRINLQNPLPHNNYQLVVNAGADATTIRDTCGIDMPIGYSIPFVVPQTTVAPVIQTISFDECHPDKVVLNFDKPVLCSSLANNGSDFSITPGVWPILSMTTNCGANTYATQVTLTLQNDLPGGNFNINIITGADATTIADTCYAFVTGGYSKPFVTTQAPAPKFDSVQFDKCSPSEIIVFYDKPINCGTVVSGGFQWYITGPSPVSIVSVSSANCATGPSKSFTLKLSAPINTFGTYVLHNQAVGLYTITDTCKAKQDPAETISFNVLGLPASAFTSQVIWACEMDTIVFSHPGGNGINSWEWVFSDGQTASGQTVTHTFPITTLTVNAALTVSNGFCSATSNQDITLGNTFTPAFTQLPKDTTCVNTAITFTDASIGAGLQYLWDFGDNTQFSGQTPPPHIYTSPNSYKVELRVSDSHGCIDTAKSNIVVTATGSLDFIGLKPQYCTGNKLTLTKVASPNIDYYIWDNGNGKMFENYRFIEVSYPDEKSYTITLSGNDKYCGATTVSKTIPVYAVPKVDLGKDTVLCPDAFMQIGVVNDPNYTYTWNTGAITSQITTDIFTRKYSLTADNHGCRASDSIAIKLLPACLIKVPGAFTPNADGNNDKLRAVNADLARSFSLRVYNRFGQLLFSTNDPMQGWDGTYKGVKQENAAYVWELNYINPWTNKPVSEKGTAILLR